MRRILLAALVLIAVSVSEAHAAIIVQSLGTGAPPAVLGGYSMTPFPNDVRPVVSNVNDVTSPLGGLLSFNIPLTHREVGNGWGSWSHGYTGDVYYSNGATSIALTLPPNTGAFYFYAEPNPFNVFNITATANDGTFLTIPVNGSAGAAGWGFYTTGGALTSITVSSNVDFAIGEFGIAAAAVPEPATMAVFGLMAVGAFGVRRRLKATA